MKSDFSDVHVLGYRTIQEEVEVQAVEARPDHQSRQRAHRHA